MTSPTDAIMRVHSLRKAVAMARECAMREALSGAVLPGLAHDTVTALAMQLQEAERDAVALIGDGYATTCGGFIAATVDDRRRVPRPKFTYRRAGYLFRRCQTCNLLHLASLSACDRRGEFLHEVWSRLAVDVVVIVE
jgi:hypothetical protein